MLAAELGDLRVSWQRMLQQDDKISKEQGGNVIALSAFALSSLQTPLAKKQLVKEMWESGANTIVSETVTSSLCRLLMPSAQILIDHSSTAGFESIAEAREVLLRMGRKELEDPETADWPIKGAHVVAPVGATPSERYL